MSRLQHSSDLAHSRHSMNICWMDELIYQTAHACWKHPDNIEVFLGRCESPPFISSYTGVTTLFCVSFWIFSVHTHINEGQRKMFFFCFKGILSNMLVSSPFLILFLFFILFLNFYFKFLLIYSTMHSGN